MSDVPTWLDRDQQHAWRAWLAVTRLLEESLDRQLQRDAGMPHAYYVVLAMLSEAQDRSLRMSELATAAHSSQSRLSHAVARLEERGWVTRSRCDEDGRGSRARLTDAGLAVVERTAPGHVAEVRRRLFDALRPDQVRQLDDILTRVLERNQAIPAPAPAPAPSSSPGAPGPAAATA